MTEVWKRISRFPDHSVSNLGNIYSHQYDRILATSLNQYGYVKISLRSNIMDYTSRQTVLVSWLVAEAFVIPPTILCDLVMHMDGDIKNLNADNLAWRPRWFRWMYYQQIRKTPIRRHYQNLEIYNCNTGNRYPSVVACGVREGLLFKDVWRSTYSGDPVFPYQHVFKVTEST